MDRSKLITAALATAVVGIVVALLFGIQGKASVEGAKITRAEPSKPTALPPDSGPERVPELPRHVAEAPDEDAGHPTDLDPNDPLLPRITPRLQAKMDDPNQKGWWNFTAEEKVAQGELQHDTADLGDVLTTLEAGERIEEVRGSAVSPEEQEAMRDAIADFAKIYEEASVSAQTPEGSIIDFAATMNDARKGFDSKISDIYGLTDDQLYEVFPHRREIEIPPAPPR